jgi:sialic acid synthase SpsE
VTGLRDIFMKSVVARRDLAKGTRLCAGDLTAKKPGTGIPARDLHTLVGRRLARAVERDQMILPDYLEEAD